MSQPNVEIRDGVMYVNGATRVVREDYAFGTQWHPKNQPKSYGSRTHVTVDVDYLTPHPTIDSLPAEFVGGLVVYLPSGEELKVPRVVLSGRTFSIQRLDLEGRRLAVDHLETYPDPPPHRAQVELTFRQVYAGP